MEWRTPLLVAALVALVALAGCSGAGDGAATRTPGGARTTVAQDGASEGGGGSSGGAGGPEYDVANRALVYTASVSLRVEDFGRARRNLTGLVRRYGGFVGGSSRRVHRRGNGTWTAGTLTLRVPSENFSDLFSRVEAAGTVRSSESSVRDVTGRVVDLEARLRNLRAQRERLRALYQGANGTRDVLRVGERLSNVQSKIERLERRLASLRRRVALSTVTVDVAEPRPEPRRETEPEPRWYDAPVTAAFRDSVGGVAAAARAAAVAAAYALPYLFAVGALAGAGLAAWRRLG